MGGRHMSTTVAPQRSERGRALWFAIATIFGVAGTTTTLGGAVERVLTGTAGSGGGLGYGLVTMLALVIAFMLGRPWLVHAPGSDAIPTPPAACPAMIGPVEREVANRDDERAGLIAAELQGYHFFTDLLRRQTKDIIDTTEEASTGIVASLQQVDRSISGMMGFLEQSSANEGVAEIVNRTEREMILNREMLQAFMDQRARDAADAGLRQEEIRKATNHLVGMVKHVRDIARSTNMLALNATIEAARAGEAGRGFSVVASEVKALSRQSDRTARDLQDGIERLQATIAESLEAIIHKHVDEESQSLSRVAKTITDLTDDLEKLIGHQREVLIRVHHESEAIAHPIMELLDSIQFQDITVSSCGTCPQPRSWSIHTSRFCADSCSTRRRFQKSNRCVPPWKTYSAATLWRANGIVTARRAVRWQ